MNVLCAGLPTRTFGSNQHTNDEEARVQSWLDNCKLQADWIKLQFVYFRD